MKKLPNRKIIGFNYFGGKFMHMLWTINKLPLTKSFVDVFGGSAIILINRPQSRIETYNDVNDKVYNFFKVLRENPVELLESIYFTPYSRKEYHHCFKTQNEGNDLERARKFFVTVNQSFNGTLTRQTGWKMSTHQSRANISEAVSRWLSKLPNLVYIVERMKEVQICNFDFRVVFEKFDSEDTLMYCDPPYLHDTRCNNNEFENEMSEDDHSDLLNLVIKTKGKVAISGYDNTLYNDLLVNFYKSEAKEKRNTLFHSYRKEILWTNYDPQEINHLSLFPNNNGHK